MAKDEIFRVRLTQKELEKLRWNAQKIGIAAPEFVRDWLKSLPDLPAEGSSRPTQQARGVHVSRRQIKDYGAGLIAPQTREHPIFAKILSSEIDGGTGGRGDGGK